MQEFTRVTDAARHREGGVTLSGEAEQGCPEKVALELGLGEGRSRPRRHMVGIPEEHSDTVPLEHAHAPLHGGDGQAVEGKAWRGWVLWQAPWALLRSLFFVLRATGSS